LVEDLLYHHVNPLSEQSSCVVHFVSNKLDLDFFVHVNLGVGHKAAHQDIGFLDFHEISAIGPADSFLFDLVPEPIIFLLERQVSDLFRTE
jgi:hypothetical protein